jgi:hypothetical protein
MLVKQQSEKNFPVYLQMLQIELIGYTEVRVHDISRVETHSWVLCSHSNMAIEIGSTTDPVGTETTISKEFWYNHPLPNTVAPSFVTCNMNRRYELDVKVGLGYCSKTQGIVWVYPYSA